MGGLGVACKMSQETKRTGVRIRSRTLYSQLLEHLEFTLYLWGSIGIVAKPVNKNLRMDGVGIGQAPSDSTTLIPMGCAPPALPALIPGYADDTAVVPHIHAVDWVVVLACSWWRSQSLPGNHLAAGCAGGWCLWLWHSGSFGRGRWPRLWKATSERGHRTAGPVWEGSQLLVPQTFPRCTPAPTGTYLQIILQPQDGPYVQHVCGFLKCVCGGNTYRIKGIEN